MTRLSAILALLFSVSAASADSVVLKSHKRDVDTVAASPDGKRLASGGDDGATIVWEANAAIATRESEDGPIDAVAFSPNGKLVAIGNQYGQVTLWDPTANKDLFSTKGNGRIVHIAFMPDGKSLYTGSWDQTIRVYDAATGKEKAKLTGPKYQLYGLALSSDGKQLVSCYSSGDVTSWSTKTNKAGPTYNPVPKTSSKGACHAVAFSPDNKSIAAGFDDGTIVVMDASTGKELRRAKVADSVNALAFATNGKLAAGTQNEELAIVDTAGAVTTMKGHGRPITDVTFTSDGKHLVSGSMDMTVRVWSVE
jgi:WD40 repeat protein